MFRDHIEDMQALKLAHQQEAAQRRAIADEQFGTAHALAAKHGFLLTRHADFHYSICLSNNWPGRRRWLTNIYPGKRRIVPVKELPERSPYIKLPEEWTLLDVVKGFVETKGLPK